MPHDRARGNGHKLKKMKFHLKKRKHFSTVRVVKHLKQLSKQQAALVDPALSREAVGLDDVQTPFSTPGIPWFLFKEETKGKQLHLSNMDYGLNVSCFLCTDQAFNKIKQFPCSPVAYI